MATKRKGTPKGSAAEPPQPSQAATKDCRGPAAAIHLIKPHIAVCLQRYTRLAEKIDQEFAGEPFLPHLSPTAPRNRARFNAYCRQHGKAFRMLCGAIDEWLRVHGLQDLASYALAVLNGRGQEDQAKNPSSSQFTEAKLRFAEQVARAGTDPKPKRTKTNKGRQDESPRKESGKPIGTTQSSRLARRPRRGNARPARTVGHTDFSQKFCDLIPKRKELSIAHWRPISKQA